VAVLRLELLPDLGFYRLINSTDGESDAAVGDGGFVRAAGSGPGLSTAAGGRSRFYFCQGYRSSHSNAVPDFSGSLGGCDYDRAGG